MKNVLTRTHHATDYLTVKQAKAHLRITSNEDDTYVAALVETVFDYLSRLVGYEVRKSTCEYFFTTPENGRFHIPARVLSITNVKYRDSAGDIQTLAAANYDEVLTISANYGYDVTLINSATSLYEYGWRYKVTVVEGFEKVGAESVDISKMFPADLFHAANLLLEHFYTQRGSEVVGVSSSPLTWNHEHLLSSYAIREFV